MTNMYELTGAELDAVAAGANAGNGVGAGGLVAVALGVAAAIDTIDIDALNNNRVTISNIANGNQVGAGVLVNLLGVAGQRIF